MSISFDKALGVHQYAIELKAQRAKILANNLANADTPGFKAQDLDFKQALQQSMAGSGFNLQKTHALHLDSQSKHLGSRHIQFSTPDQPDTGDGNTVDAQKETSKFAENALEYQMTLQFLSGKFKAMKTAIKGE